MEFNIIAFFVFLFGISFGSFLNVLIYRVPKGLNIIKPASSCPSCNATLKWYHNIPLLSWLILGRKCAFCNEPISLRYFLIELANGVLWVAIYFKIGFVWYMPFIALSFSMLLALSMIDIKYFAVPDSLNFAALFFALINSNFFYHFKDALIAAFGFWLLGFIVSKISKKDALGEADIIVAATMAALLGYPLFFIAMFLAALLAIIPSLIAKDTMVPFVPFLALGTLIAFLYDTILINWLEVIIYD